MTTDLAALLRDAIISGMRIATETPIEQVPAAIADVLAALSAALDPALQARLTAAEAQIDKADVLRIVMEECYKDREMKLATRIAERLAALTTEADNDRT